MTHEPPELCRHCGCSFVPASIRGDRPGPCHGNNPKCENLILEVIRVYDAGVFDDVFTITLRTGETVVWNVTRLNAAAKAGTFGAPLYGPVADLPPADWSSWDETDRAKVDGIKTNPAALDEPVIAIESPVQDFLLNCFVDGQHRITARQELGLKEFAFYLVPLSLEGAFRVVGFPTEGMDIS